MEKEFRGWRDNKITEQTPIGAIVEYLNIVNERLILIEDAIKANVDGKEMTLTEYWIEVQKQEFKKFQEAMAQQAQAQTEQAEQTEQTEQK